MNWAKEAEAGQRVLRTDPKECVCMRCFEEERKRYRSLERDLFEFVSGVGSSGWHPAEGRIILMVFS